MRKRMADPAVRAATLERLREAREKPENRASASARMKRLNARMQTDDDLKAKCIKGQKRFRRSPIARAIQSAVMADIMSRPEMKRQARAHAVKINKDPKVRRRQWAGRRRKKYKREWIAERRADDQARAGEAGTSAPVKSRARRASNRPAKACRGEAANSTPQTSRAERASAILLQLLHQQKNSD